MFNFHPIQKPGGNGHFCMSQQCLAEKNTSSAEIFTVASITLQPNKIENSSVRDEPEK